MKFLFVNTPQISSRYLLIVSPGKYVGRASKQAQTWLLLLSLKYRDNKDQQTGLLVKDTQETILMRIIYFKLRNRIPDFFALSFFPHVLILDNGNNFTTSRKFNCE